MVTSTASSLRIPAPTHLALDASGTRRPLPHTIAMRARRSVAVSVAASPPDDATGSTGVPVQASRDPISLPRKTNFSILATAPDLFLGPGYRLNDWCGPRRPPPPPKRLPATASPEGRRLRRLPRIPLHGPPPPKRLPAAASPEFHYMDLRAAPFLLHARAHGHQAMAPPMPFARVPLCLLVAAALPLLSVAAAQETCSGIVPGPPRRGAWMCMASFGGAGDGRTLNTAAFARAVVCIKRRRARGGALLYVPPRVWLTGPFNLTSHMTLFLARGTVIRATQDTSNWPLIDPLPSYGRGRELPGGRYISLIHGNGVEDVFITGENGTIDGQGSMWWDMWRKRTLAFTRPHLLELISSTDVTISNVIFQDSPFWNIHPVYCSNVVIANVTVVAPHDSPNTDGIDPAKILGLDICADTIVGDEMIKGISGGQKKRLTTVILPLSDGSSKS